MQTYLFLLLFVGGSCGLNITIDGTKNCWGEDSSRNFAVVVPVTPNTTYVARPLAGAVCVHVGSTLCWKTCVSVFDDSYSTVEEYQEWSDIGSYSAEFATPAAALKANLLTEVVLEPRNPKLYFFFREGTQAACTDNSGSITIELLPFGG
eukprot:TRINITY_DN67960_c7_g1_i5.p1 TRINITY_DN67960_c7_g1~~TRINITY_DN67960_c7_g1_i5.p1  ORF type:complete len:150 (+),score=6.37 TRINITY_DN67960_c7_g1_i5:20-469(+)